jgi:hypothetical protein
MIIEENLPKFNPDAPAWWISPQGKILSLKNNETHISKVIENPKAFGYTLNEIETIYHLFGEQVGIEKKAREQIIKDILNKGWIRIRNNTVQLSFLAKDAKEYVYDWLSHLIVYLSPFNQININTKDRNEIFIISDLINSLLSDDYSKDNRKKLTPVNSVFDL